MYTCCVFRDDWAPAVRLMAALAYTVETDPVEQALLSQLVLGGLISDDDVLHTVNTRE